MNNEDPLTILEDQQILLDAYAASSAYVLRKIFNDEKKLKVFKGKTDLAPTILEKIQELTKEPGNPVILSLHLFALELTGADAEIISGTVQVMRDKTFRLGTMEGQFACHVGSRFVGREKTEPGSYFETEEIEEVFQALKGKEEKK
jgi:hypothetical protein